MATDLDGFLRELAELSLRYGLWISGCGECGSPWVEASGDGSADKVVGQYLTPTRELDGYEVNVEDTPYADKRTVRVEPASIE